MQKRILIVAGLAALLASRPAAAERKYGIAGCGLGSLVFKPSGNQSTAALLNGTGYQTLGITTGTSNCTPSGAKASAELEQEKFFVANFATLSKEIAQGGGDAVVAFAGSLGCAQGNAGRVATQLQANYADIFAEPGAVAAFDAAKDSLRTDPEITAKCQYL